MREKKGAFEPPEEVSGEVDKILRTINTEGRWNLVCYREESLNEALRILRKHGKRMLLQSAIKAEIDERIKNRTQPGRKPSSTVYWFTPRWEAVRALFGKGSADLNDKATQEFLDSIDLKWVGNCKGEL